LKQTASRSCLAARRGSHRQYKRTANEGETRLVTVAYHNINDDVLPGTLSSMIRQSGLPKRLFRK